MDGITIGVGVTEEQKSAAMATLRRRVEAARHEREASVEAKAAAKTAAKKAARAAPKVTRNESGSSRESGSFTVLSLDLLVSISAHLPPLDLITLATCICKSWRALGKEPTVWA